MSTDLHPAFAGVFLLFSTVLGWLGDTINSARGAEESDSSTSAVASEPIPVGFGSWYCGPRCVQRTLAEYGIDMNLVDLIREMQWPALEEGTSMDSLAAALNSRGVYTRAVDLDPEYAIEWSGPAIVHLKRGNITHYVVWLPPSPSNSAARIWDGDRSEALKPGMLRDLRTGPVLLTSTRPISDDAMIGRRNPVALFSFRNLLLLATTVGIAFGSAYTIARRRALRIGDANSQVEHSTSR